MKKSLTSQTIRGFLWLASGKGSKALLQLGVLAILARLLTPAEFGLIGLALIVVSFSEIFTDLGFGPAITQKEILTENDIRTGFTFSILFGFVLVAMLWFSAPMFSLLFREEDLIWILRAVSLVLLLKAVSSVANALLYRRMDYKKLAMIEFISFGIGYGALGTFMAFQGFGVWALVGAVLGQASLSSMLLMIYSSHPKKLMYNSKSLKTLATFGGGYSIGKIFSYIGNKGDKIIVGRLLGTDALGLYERAYQLVKFVAGLTGEVIDKVLFAPIAKKQKEREKLGKIYLDLTSIISLILFPISVLLYINALEIVSILLGDQWFDIVVPVQIMSISLFFLVCSRVGSTLAKSLGDVYSRAFRNFIFAGLIIIGSILAVRWGITGVTVAVLIAFLVNYLLAFTQVRKLTGIRNGEFIYSHFTGLFMTAGYGLLIIVLTEYSRSNQYSPLVTLSINSSILLFIFIACYTWLPLQTVQHYKRKILYSIQN